MIPGTRKFHRFNPKDNCQVCCWVLSGMSTSSDVDVNTVHHDDTNDAAEDHNFLLSRTLLGSRSMLDNGCLSHMKTNSSQERFSAHLQHMLW